MSEREGSFNLVRISNQAYEQSKTQISLSDSPRIDLQFPSVGSGYLIQSGLCISNEIKTKILIFNNYEKDFTF
ncbi:MAG: hypothetical protein EA341_12825 [Mongoliibacter sp.]|nr:MAG: hypothetical protein EA341_12825 [Mongoliibacter sp.]